MMAYQTADQACANMAKDRVGAGVGILGGAINQYDVEGTRKQTSLSEIEDVLLSARVPAPAFRVGDVVALKSGGPMMTVLSLDSAFEIAGAPGLSVAWIDAAGAPHRLTVPSASVVVVRR